MVFRKGGSHNKKLVGLTNIQELSYYKQLHIHSKQRTMKSIKNNVETLCYYASMYVKIYVRPYLCLGTYILGSKNDPWQLQDIPQFTSLRGHSITTWTQRSR